MEQFLKREHIKTSGDYKTFVTNGGCLFPFAIESWKNDKFSYVYTTHTNDLDYIRSLLESDNNLFEIIKSDSCKLYLDFDKQTITDLNEFVEQIVDKINECLESNVTTEEVVVLTNRGDKINSVHLIFNSIEMPKQDQKCLVQYINQTTDLDIDDRVYTMNRNFRCVNQSKSAKQIPFIQRINHFDILDTLVSINVNGKLYSFEKTHSIKKDKTQYIKPLELIDLILENKYEYIFVKNSGGSWCKITHIVAQFFPEKLEEWLQKSSNEKYSYEDNKKFAMDGEHWEDYNYIYVIVNTKINQSIHYSERISSTETIKAYLAQWFNEENIEIILDSDENEFIQDDVKYTIENGFITDGVNFKINYFYDTIEPEEYPNITMVDTIQSAKEKLGDFLVNRDKLFVLKSSWGSGKTHHIMKEAIKQNLHKRILIITGINSLNTTLTSMFNSFLEEHDTPLFVSHIEAQKNKNIILKNCPKVICSIQSLCKLSTRTYDLVIMDESESVMHSYFSHTTFKHSTCHSLFNDMVHILNSSRKIIALDADVSEPKIKLLHSITSGNAVIYKNQQLSFQDTKFILHTGSELEFIHHIIDEQKANQKLVLPCATRKTAMSLLYIFTNVMSESEKLPTEYIKLVAKYYDDIKHRTILYIDKNGCFLYNPDEIHHDKHKLNNEIVYKDLDSFLSTNKVDTFIYTPTITTGLSINDAYFNKCYSISNHNSINYNEYIQMLMRTRILSETHIWLNEKIISPYNNQTSAEEIKESRDKLNHIFKELKYGSEMEDELVLLSSHYCDAQLINIATVWNTRRNFIFNIIQILRYHKLNYCWNTKVATGTYSIDLELNKEAMEDDEYDQWKSIELLAFVDYCKQRMCYEFRGQPFPRTGNADYKTYMYADENIDDKSAFKTNLLYRLIGLDKISIVNEATSLFVPTLDSIKELHTLLYSPIKNKENIPSYKKWDDKLQLHREWDESNVIVEYSYDVNRVPSIYETVQDKIFHKCCDEQIKRVLEYFDLKEIWFKYIYKENYKKINEVRRLVKHPKLNSLSNSNLSFTPLDESRVTFELTRLVVQAFHINFNDLHSVNKLTNKELVDILKSMNLESHKKPTKKEAIVFLKKHLELLDFVAEYLDKTNSSHNNAKLVIHPKQQTHKNYIVDWKIPKYRLIKTLDQRFMYLHTSENAKNTNNLHFFKDVKPVEVETYNQLINKKNISSSEKKQLFITQLLLGAKELTIEDILKPYYYNELIHKKKFTTIDSYTHTFYISKHKNKLEVEFRKASVSTFKKQRNGQWVKTGTKIIIRPYKFVQSTKITSKKTNISKQFFYKYVIIPTISIKHIEI